MPTAPRLVLFDIDGTLLDLHGAGRIAFARCLEHVFGWKNDLAHIRFAGATDLDLLHKLMRQHGREPTPADETAFFDRLAVELEDAAAASTELTLYPGVRELLRRLGDDPRCHLGLVTGNIASCALIKLRLFDLHGHFELGAFGHEHADRVEIARLALRRCADRLPAGAAFASMSLIGDTPSDIRAALAIGAQAVAVATGGYARADLEAAGAHAVLDDLSDTARVLRLVGLG